MTTPGRRLADGRSFAWLAELGLSEAELGALNSCVPGEFTLPDALYVNTGTPGVVYRGTEEGTLPMVAGRWYMIPSDTVSKHASLTRDTVPVSRAVRLLR